MPHMGAHMHYALALVRDQVRAAGMFQAVGMRLLERDLGHAALSLAHQVEDPDPREGSTQPGREEHLAHSVPLPPQPGPYR